MKLPDTRTRVIIQGITGERGTFHTQLMLEAGTKVVAGVSPGRGGLAVHGVPVYETVSDALDEHDAEASVVFAPAQAVPSAVYEAIEDELKLVVVVASGVPLRDTLRFLRLARDKETSVIGPSSPGIALPGGPVLGVVPHQAMTSGNVALVARYGPLVVETASQLSAKGHGQSICIGLGEERIVGVDEGDVLAALADHDRTRSVLLVVDPERSVAAVCEGLDGFTKPIVAFVPGTAAAGPQRSRAVRELEHAGVLVVGNLAKAMECLSSGCDRSA